MSGTRVSNAGGGTSLPGVTGDGQTPGGINVAGSESIGVSLNIGDLSNPPDSFYPLQIGIGGQALYLDQNGKLVIKGIIRCTGVNATDEENYFSSSDAFHGAVAIFGAGTIAGHANTLEVSNGNNLKVIVDSLANVIIAAGLGVFGHNAPADQPVLATGAGATVDDVITLLQSYGLCKQV